MVSALAASKSMPNQLEGKSFSYCAKPHCLHLILYGRKPPVHMSAISQVNNLQHCSEQTLSAIHRPVMLQYIIVKHGQQEWVTAIRSFTPGKESNMAPS